MHKENQWELGLTLISSWAVYATCQQDILLPVLAGLAVLFSFVIFRQKPIPSDKPLSLPSLIAFSLLIGWFYRNLNPPQEVPYATSILLDRTSTQMVATIQSTLIFVSVFLWFRRSYRFRSYALRLTSWMTVAVSINVAFDAVSAFAFWFFCLLALGFILAKAIFPSREDRQRIFIPLLSFKNTLFLILVVLMTSGFFFILISGIQIGDRVFMQFIRDYAIFSQHQFLRFDSSLIISGPGYSGLDVRPVFEVRTKPTSRLYLKTQVFETYQNGTWQEPANIEAYPVTNELNPHLPMIEITLFRYLEGIVPSPQNVTAVHDKNLLFEIDQNGIIHSLTSRFSKVKVNDRSEDLRPDYVSPAKQAQLTKLPEILQKYLKDYVAPVIGNHTAPVRIAQDIEEYFHNKFKYALKVNFTANNEGLLMMLKERRPAYCSFFASAMALMLREQNIPSRLVTGFLVNEKMDGKGGHLLARVRDAHAWVEALLPDANNPQIKYWVAFDPTPYASRSFLLSQGHAVNPAADRIYLYLARLRAEILNINSAKMMQSLVLILSLFLLLKNIKNIFYFLTHLRDFRQRELHRTVSKQKKQYEGIYRQFEIWIRKNFQMQIYHADTDEELVYRLQQKKIPPDKLTVIKQFLKQYHAARFGDKEVCNLVELLHNLPRK